MEVPAIGEAVAVPPAGQISASAVLKAVKARLDEAKKRTIDFLQEIDKGCDGFLTIDELRNAFNMLGFQLSEAELEAVVARLDKDGTGDISIREFDRGLKAVDREGKKRRIPRDRDVVDEPEVVEQTEDLKTLDEMMEMLTRQQRRLRHHQRAEAKCREDDGNQRAAAERSKFAAGAPWLRPSQQPGEFSVDGRLPVLYLAPLQASRVDRPNKSFDPQPEVPFRYANATPRILGKFPMLPNSARAHVPFAGDNLRGEGPEFKTALRPFKSITPRTPRAPSHHAEHLAGVQITRVAPRWSFKSIMGVPSFDHAAVVSS